jgi:hypothetical protein
MEPRVTEMETELHEAMAAGVFVEVRDAGNNTLAQAVYVDWRGRPLPAVGDLMNCDAVLVASGRRARLRGRVRTRQFDVQQESDGAAAVWVRVVLDFVTAGREETPPTGRKVTARFSSN